VKFRLFDSHGVSQALGKSQPGVGTFDGIGTVDYGRYHQMISEIRIRSVKPTERPYKLTDTRGLYLYVMPNGSRYWRLNYRFDGRQKTLAMGTYPDVPLVRARERLQDARKLLADGIDPGAVKQTVSRDFPDELIRCQVAE
jgi:hypothetical protein